MRRSLILLVPLALAGCASAGGEASLADRGQRGYELARSQCAVCHAITPGERSPNPSSPPFLDIGRRYNALAFEERLREIARGSHYQMPPTDVAPADAADIGTYISRLGLTPAPCGSAAGGPACAP